MQRAADHGFPTPLRAHDAAEIASAASVPKGHASSSLSFGDHIQLEYAIGQYRIAGEDPTGALMLACTSGPMDFGDWMCRSPRHPNRQSDTVQLNA